MADDVIREPHSVRRATGPLFRDELRFSGVATPTPVEGLLASIDPAMLDQLSDDDLTALLRVADAGQRTNRKLIEALRYEIVARIIQRNPSPVVLQPDEESA